MHHKRVGNKGERCDVVRSMEPFCRQGVTEMVPGDMDEGFAKAHGRRVWRGFKYRRVFLGDEVVECSAWTKLKMTAGKLLRRKPVRERQTLPDAAQQSAIAKFQRRVEHYDEPED